MSQQGWYGFDLDGTLAHYEKWVSADHIGAPIPETCRRVQQLLAEGKQVKIFTARVSSSASDEDRAKAHEAITKFCVTNFGKPLEVTSEKDFGMIQLFDDRCQTVEANTGRILSSPSPMPVPDFSNPEQFNKWMDEVEACLKLVKERRVVQLQKHGCNNHDIPTWLAILMEEVGELHTIYLNGKLGDGHDLEALRSEAIDVAACAAALLQYLRQGVA